LIGNPETGRCAFAGGCNGSRNSTRGRSSGAPPGEVATPYLIPIMSRPCDCDPLTANAAFLSRVVAGALPAPQNRLECDRAFGKFGRRAMQRTKSDRHSVRRERLGCGLSSDCRRSDVVGPAFARDASRIVSERLYERPEELLQQRRGTWTVARRLVTTA
jgi:hypothetical protein